MKKLPKTIYVQRWNEGEGDDEFLQVNLKADTLDEGASTEVGIYELVKVKKFKVTRELT